MHFTDDELKMVRWLRNQHAGWRTTRGIIVTCSILTIALGVWLIVYDGFDLAKVIMLVVGAGGLSYTLGSWTGRPEISLLLKLIEAQNPDASQDNQA